ncbi:MAG: PHP domain-containing protein [Gemmatimonadota bacterium]
MAVDLHSHTTVSDGALAPAELVALAAQRGVNVLAITDHDTMGGIAAARAAAGSEVTVLAGVELTCHVDGREAHILGYGIDPDDAAFQTALERFTRQRAERAATIVEKLNAVGIEMTFDEVAAISGSGTIARPHVAQALVARGVVGSLNEAFTRFLGRGAPAYVDKPRFEPGQAFDLVKAAGGVPSLAHPGTFARDQFIPELVAAGLEALEVRHTEHSAAQCGHYERLAEQHGLLPTGGSDFHGTPGHRSRLGVPLVPEAWAEALMARVRAPR